MGISGKASDDFTPSGGKYLDQEGWFHLIVASATDTPTNKDGVPINNCCAELDCTVLAGTVPECREKIVSLKFFTPDPSHKDGGEMAQKKLTLTLYALGAIETPGADFDVNPDDLVGRQMVVHLTKRDANSKYLDIAYTDIFHVDDPKVKDHPRDIDALSAIPQNLRRIGQQAPPKKPHEQPAAQPAKQSAASAPKSIDDIAI